MSDFKPRTQTVYLMQGDDIERAEELRAEVTAAIARQGDAEATLAGLKKAPARAGGDPEVEKATEYLDSARAESVAAVNALNEHLEAAETRATVVTVRHLGRRIYRDMRRSHPPRDGDAQDQAYGFNVDEFGDVMVPAAVIEPVFPSDAAKAEFLDALSDAQWSQLFSAAVKVNQGALPDPKARIGSDVMQALGETSESPARLA